MNQPKTAEEQRNATVIRALYASAEAAAKDTAKFVSMFGEGGYFYDVGAGKEYYGKETTVIGRLRVSLSGNAARGRHLLRQSGCL